MYTIINLVPTRTLLVGFYNFGREREQANKLKKHHVKISQSWPHINNYF